MAHRSRTGGSRLSQLTAEGASQKARAQLPGHVAEVGAAVRCWLWEVLEDPECHVKEFGFDSGLGRSC